MAGRTHKALLAYSSVCKSAVSYYLQTFSEPLARSCSSATSKLSHRPRPNSWRTATNFDFSIKPSVLSPLHVAHDLGGDRAAKAQILRDWLTAQPLLDSEHVHAGDETEIQKQLEKQSSRYTSVLRRLQHLRNQPAVPDLAEPALMHAYYNLLAKSAQEMDEDFLRLQSASMSSGALWQQWLENTAVTYSEVPSLEALSDVYSMEDPEKELQLLKAKAQRLVHKVLKVRTIRSKVVDGKYWEVGRRKTSVALTMLQHGDGQVFVNGLSYDQYFQDVTHRAHMLKPFIITSTQGRYDVKVSVRGGGLSCQAQAAAHGISKAIARSDVQLQPLLSQAGLLKRDKRIVERKKPGRKKARKSFTWVKR